MALLPTHPHLIPHRHTFRDADNQGHLLFDCIDDGVGSQERRDKDGCCVRFDVFDCLSMGEECEFSQQATSVTLDGQRHGSPP